MAEKHEHVFVEDGDYLHAAGECEICGLHYRDYIKQLRAREAALVEIVDWVGRFYLPTWRQDEHVYACDICSARKRDMFDFPHTPECLVTKVRALLVAESEPS